MKKLNTKNFYEIAKNNCKVFDDLSDSYYHFSKEYKNELYENHSIDAGFDYACHIFAVLENELINLK